LTERLGFVVFTHVPSQSSSHEYECWLYSSRVLHGWNKTKHLTEQRILSRGAEWLMINMTK